MVTTAGGFGKGVILPLAVRRRVGIGCDWNFSGGDLRCDWDWDFFPGGDLRWSCDCFSGGDLWRDDDGNALLCATLLLRSSAPVFVATLVVFFRDVDAFDFDLAAVFFFRLGMMPLGLGVGDPGWDPLVFAIENKKGNGLRGVSEVNWWCKWWIMLLCATQSKKKMFRSDVRQ